MSSIDSPVDHRKALALIVCLFVLFSYKELVWDPYFHPVTPTTSSALTSQSGQGAVPSSQSGPLPTTAPVAGQPALPLSPSVARPAGSVPPSDAQLRAAGAVTVRTEALEVELSLLGGRVFKLLLNDFAASLGKDAPRLNLVQHVDQAPLPLGVTTGEFDDSWVSYALVSPASAIQPISVVQPTPVVLRGQLGDGRTIEKRFTFDPATFYVSVDISLSAPPADGTRLSLEWTEEIPADSPLMKDSYNIAGAVWFDGANAPRSKYSLITAERKPLGDVRWVALADKYFMSALVNPADPSPGVLFSTDQVYHARLSGTDTHGSFVLYAGPKKYRDLKESPYQLHRAIDLGITGVISAPLLSLLHQFYDVVGNYGLAIILLTICVRLCLYPLNASAYRQMKSMQDLSPELKRIRETVKDKQQQQAEMMALYQKKGVNPLGGCLPMFIQMPIFIGLYSAFLLAIELRHAPFVFWIQDLSSQERLMLGGIGVPVMVILFVISMVVQQILTPSNLDPVQQRMMYFMPLIFGFMFANMPAGLTLYWLTNNLISIGQQAGFRRSGGGKSALLLTLGVAAAVFATAFVLTKLS